MGFGEWMQGAWNATGGQVFGTGGGGSTDEFAASSQSSAQISPPHIEDIIQQQSNPSHIEDIIQRQPNSSQIEDIIQRQPSSSQIEDIIQRQSSSSQIEDIIQRQPSSYQIEDIIQRQPSSSHIEDIIRQQPISAYAGKISEAGSERYGKVGIKMGDLGIQPLGPRGSEGLRGNEYNRTLPPESNKSEIDINYNKILPPPQLPPMSMGLTPLPSYSAMDISRNSHPAAMDIPLPPKSMDAIPSFGGRGYSDALVGFGNAPKGSGETIGGKTLSNIGVIPLERRGSEMAGVYRKSKPTYSFLKRTPEKQIKSKQFPPKIKQDLKPIINIEVINKNMIPKSLGKGFATVVSPDKLVKSMGAHTKVKGTGKVKTDVLGLTNIKNITGNINIPGFGSNLTKSKSGNFGMVGNIDNMLKGIISPVKIKKIKLK